MSGQTAGTRHFPPKPFLQASPITRIWNCNIELSQQIRAHKMAALTDDVRVPLLTSRDSAMLDELEDDVGVRYPLQGAGKGVYRSGRAGKDSYFQGTANNGGMRRIGSEQATALGARRKKKQYSGSEMIVVVFVVAFDTKKGGPLSLNATC